MDATSCVGVLELGNRLCLPRLITLTEQVVIARLTEVIEDGGDVTDEALNILQPCQVMLLSSCLTDPVVAWIRRYFFAYVSRFC